MKTFLIRLSSGLVVAALAITAMLYNQYTFGALMSIILLGSLNEYFNLTEAKRDKPKSFFQGRWFAYSVGLSGVEVRIDPIRPKPGAAALHPPTVISTTGLHRPTWASPTR